MQIEQSDDGYRAKDSNGLAIAECKSDPEVARNWEPCSPYCDWSRRRQEVLQMRIVANFRVFGAK